MITSIFTLLTGGIEAYRQHKQNKANELKRKDEFEQQIHHKNLERLQAGDTQATSLDELSIKTRGWKDEFLFIFFIPIVMCFIPGYAQYVHQGFASLEEIPQPYWWVIGAIVIDTLGMRSMLRYLLEYYSSRRGNDGFQFIGWLDYYPGHVNQFMGCYIADESDQRP